MRPRVQDGHSDAVTQGRTPPPSSLGSCKPIDEYPDAVRGPCRRGEKAGVPAVSHASYGIGHASFSHIAAYVPIMGVPNPRPLKTCDLEADTCMLNGSQPATLRWME